MMNQIELIKRCPKCGCELPLNEFGKNKKNKNGLQCYCKVCARNISKAYYDNHKYERHISAKKYRDNHKSEISLRDKKYYSCVKKPSCLRVGGNSAQFEVFTCKICGREFRRNKAKVNWRHKYYGTSPNFCSKECQFESMKKSHKSKYENEIERIKKEVKE